MNLKSFLARIRSLLYFRKIRNRFLFSIIIISLPSLFLLGFLSFNITRSMLTEQQLKTDLDHLQTASSVGDLLLNNIINVNRTIVNDQTIRNLLYAKKHGEAADDHEFRSQMISQLQNVIYNNLYDTRYIRSVCILDTNLESYCLGRPDDTGIYENADKANSIRQARWYTDTISAQGKVVFSTFNVFGEQNGTFSSTKLFRDSNTIQGEELGMIVVNVSTTLFGRAFNNNQNPGYFAVYVPDVERTSIIYLQAPTLADLLIEAPHDDMEGYLLNQGYLMRNVKNQTSGWMFAHIIEEQALLEASKRIRTVTMLIGALIALLAIVMAYVISGTITRPLIRIKKMMMSWNHASQDEISEYSFRDDEVGVIGETFKKLALENDHLNTRLVHSQLREKEAELSMLQAQINPHFLYNTLNSIYMMVRLNRTEEAAQMALSLSESFKISLNKGKDTIAVYKELELIRHYITIQNIRYKGRFHYQEEVDPAVKRVEILKLILQPLIENSIYHGLEPKIGPGNIRLEGRMDGEYVVFIVEDDGVGIPDMSRVEQGYGIRNVRERLRLHYGPTSSLDVTSEPGRGTKITIRFRMNQDEVTVSD